MSHRYRIRNQSKLATARIRASLKRLRARLLSSDTGTVTDALQGLVEVFEEVLPKLGKPRLKPNLLPQDGDPDPVAWNENLDAIEEDLRVAFEAVDEVRHLRSEVANDATLARKELEEKANLATSMLTDLRLTAGQLGQEVIVASDDFLNANKIDFGFPLQFPQAEVNTLQGAVTLKRTEAISVLMEGASVNVTPLTPEGLQRLPTPENLFRFYEGRFYAPLGEARPEGGRWHFEEKVRPGVEVSGDSQIFEMNEDREAELGEFLDQFPDLRRAADQRPQGFSLRPEDVLVIDRGASLIELQAQRKKMLDGSADNWWECEFVVDSKALDDLIANKELEEATITPQELRARAAAADIDLHDFGVEIVIRFDRRQTINFITINPMNFNETAWLEITEVSTASDENDAFVPIEGFDDQVFENVLTDQANAELAEGEATTVLAPSKYAYRGQGVYSFPPREASRVRVRLRQRTPTPSEYERIVIQLTRTLTQTQASTKGSCFPSGTMISTMMGPRPIETFKPGETVLSFHKGKVRSEWVTKVLSHPPQDYVITLLSDGSVFQATPNHLVLTNSGWLPVRKLLPDMQVMHVNGRVREFVPVVYSKTVPAKNMFNLYTTGAHTFIADGVVVHNFVFMRRLRTFLHRVFFDVRP